MDTSADKYLDKYQELIDDGKIMACRKLKRALRRESKDLRKVSKKDYPYYFDQAKADQAINFLQILTTTDGEPLRLEPFQAWIISNLFGWRRKSNHTRRFSEAFISFARKSGKSFLMSRIAALYLLVEDQPKLNREVLMIANSFKQAKISFNMLASGLNQLMKESPSLMKRLKINNAEIKDNQTGSHAIAMASNLQTLDGWRSDLAIIDEYAEASDSRIKDVIKTGQINSDNSLLAVISTSGNNLNSPMFKDYQFADKVLKGKAEAPELFIAIYEQDFKNEVIKAIDQPQLLEKSNPLLSNKERRSIMLPKLVADIKLAAEQDNLLPVYVKSANMWLQARKNSYIAAKNWSKATVPPVDVKGKPVYIGIDLSKSSDLTSISWLIPYEADGRQKFYCDSHSWIATKYGLDQKIKTDRFDYRAGAKRGECTITDLKSGIIDYDQVINWLIGFVQTNSLQVQGICYDPWSFGILIRQFEQLGWQLIKVRQGRRTLSEPTITFRDKLLNGEIKHPQNQLLAFAVNNAVLTYDRQQNPLIDKVKSENKIDPLAALMNAWTIGGTYWSDKAAQHSDEYYLSDEFSF